MKKIGVCLLNGRRIHDYDLALTVDPEAYRGYTATVTHPLSAEAPAVVPVAVTRIQRPSGRIFYLLDSSQEAIERARRGNGK